MAVNEIRNNGIIIAKHITADEWKEGLNFFSADNDFIQAGIWNYNKGKELAAHIHNKVKREISHTQEVIFIRKGSLLAKIYNEQEELISEITAQEGDVLIMLAGGHGYTILEDGTQVLEIKNGPYVGPDQDRRRI